MIRAYKYKAFPPLTGEPEFSRAVAMKRDLWKALIEIETEYDARKAVLTRAADFTARIAAAPDAAKAALRAERQRHIAAIKPELLALGSWRVDQQRHAKQAAAASGLHWGDYNAVTFQFDGARAAARARGASVYNFETACGEAIVNQIMNGRRPAQMIGFSQCGFSFCDDPAATQRKQGSRRAGYRMCLLDATVRGPRNPQGPARLKINFVMHRPLPPNSMVKEVRVIRKMRAVINREGRCFDRPDWSVIFVISTGAPTRADDRCAGLSLTWRDTTDEGDLFPFGYLFDGKKIKTLWMDDGHKNDWNHRAALARKAEETGEAVDAAELESFSRRLMRRRQLAHREAAANIARIFSCVAIQKIDLSNKGTKQHVAPAAFRLALRHALESRGGTLIEVFAPLKKDETDPHERQARVLFEAAKDDFNEGIEHVAA